MSSPAKIAANLENARKSTGPRSERGKSKSRLNAVKFGIYSTIPVLPGENAESYLKLEKSNLEYFAPVGPVEMFLVRQITREEWRIERIQTVENTLAERSTREQIVRFLGSLNETETHYVSSTYQGELREELLAAQRAQEAVARLEVLRFPNSVYTTPQRQFPAQTEEETHDNVEERLGRILDAENIQLESLVPHTERAPQAYLVQERRSAMRAYLTCVDKLGKLQAYWMTLTLPAQPKATLSIGNPLDAQN
jgi:hypothetical protein